MFFRVEFLKLEKLFDKHFKVPSWVGRESVLDGAHPNGRRNSCCIVLKDVSCKFVDDVDGTAIGGGGLNTGCCFLVGVVVDDKVLFVSFPSNKSVTLS